MSPAPAPSSTVLIVDDTPANPGVLFELLSTAGFEVLVAEDGASAVQRAAYAQPGLILLDVLMPGMDGFATCAVLKERPDTRQDRKSTRLNSSHQLISYAVF